MCHWTIDHWLTIKKSIIKVNVAHIVEISGLYLEFVTSFHSFQCLIWGIRENIWDRKDGQTCLSELPLLVKAQLCLTALMFILNKGFITTLLSASLSTCLKRKTKNKYKQINNFIVKKNYFSQMSACWCNHSNESVNKSTRRKDLFGAKNPFSDGENLSGSQWIVLPQNIS